MVSLHNIEGSASYVFVDKFHSNTKKKSFLIQYFK